MASSPPLIAEIEAGILESGKEIWNKTQGESPGLFDKSFWQGKLMEWAMKDETFKLDLFRFVDVLPSLKNGDQVAEHVRQYLIKEGRELPAVMEMALKAASGGWTSGLAAMAIRKNVTDMAERFIVGKHAKDAIPVLKKLHKEGIAFTADLLGEATLSQSEAIHCQSRYIDLIDNLSRESAGWAEDPVIDFNHLGRIPRTNVSLKISAMDAQLRAEDPKGAVSRLKQLVLPLFLKAREKNVFINMDLEQWEYHGLTYDLFEEIVMDPRLTDWPHLGVVVQAYLVESKLDVERLLGIAKARRTPLTIRLVKGAYWDYEVVRAKQNGFTCPVFTEKAATDANYEALTAFMLQHLDHLHPAFGSHNLRSVTHALVLAKQMGLPSKALEVQMLYGMAEAERKVFRSMGHRVRVYSAMGELLPGMAYLVRRLLENTSNNGFLRLSHADGIDPEKLLRKPSSSSLPESPSLQAKRPRDDSMSFENVPNTDFTLKSERESFQKAVVGWEARFPIKVPAVLSGCESFTPKHFAHRCPWQPMKVVTEVSLSSLEMVEKAIQEAGQAWLAWSDLAVDHRAACLERLADLLVRDRIELAALQVWEVGKPWKEADADVAEAIDFCRYYAQQARKELAPQRMGIIPGEDNLFFHSGRGVAVVIAPWNFPLAILCGMATAALVAGNAVLMKPAEQSSAMAWELYKRMEQAGFPKGVIHLLPGYGHEIGPLLVGHQEVATIVFTGSKKVGLSILESAGKTGPGQLQVKGVVCEMGGKNAIVVDDDADLDQAVIGILHSAFGFAGQKCSACSRVLVVESAAETFIGRLVEAARSLIVSSPLNPGCTLGPVIDQESYQRLMKIIQNPGEGATLLYRGEVPPEEMGYFVPATLFKVGDSRHRLMRDEFFGPVIAVMVVPDFEEAIRVANDVEFHLTGAVYSRNPEHLKLARKHFRVGNLYLNRGSTGALVYRQPFGGFGMSGGGTKAGGPGYLLNFTDPRSITENTMRCGFTVDEPVEGKRN